MEIKKTYDYSKFKFLSYNRAVGSNKKLMRSLMNFIPRMMIEKF